MLHSAGTMLHFVSYVRRERAERYSMAIVQISELPGMTREQYEQGWRELNFSGPPPGSHLHAGGPVEGGWRIVEVWESEEVANAFYSSEAFQQMARNNGLPAPKITNYPVESIRK